MQLHYYKQYIIWHIRIWFDLNLLHSTRIIEVESLIKFRFKSSKFDLSQLFSDDRDQRNSAHYQRRRVDQFLQEWRRVDGKDSQTSGRIWSDMCCFRRKNWGIGSSYARQIPGTYFYRTAYLYCSRCTFDTLWLPENSFHRSDLCLLKDHLAWGMFHFDPCRSLHSEFAVRL